MKKVFKIDFGQFDSDKKLTSEYSLFFEVQPHPIAELWYEKMYNLLSDSSWKLETRWAAFKLPSRHPKILVEKLKSFPFMTLATSELHSGSNVVFR